MVRMAKLGSSVQPDRRHSPLSRKDVNHSNPVSHLVEQDAKKIDLTPWFGSEGRPEFRL